MATKGKETPKKTGAKLGSTKPANRTPAAKSATSARPVLKKPRAGDLSSAGKVQRELMTSSDRVVVSDVLDFRNVTEVLKGRIPESPGIDSFLVTSPEHAVVQPLVRSAAAQLITKLAPLPRGIPFSEIRRSLTTIATSMDPRLQLAMINRLSGRSAIPTAATANDELAVLARVTSFKAWEECEGVVVGAKLGQDGDDSVIVTGRIPLDLIETVRANEAVLSLKATQAVWPTLQNTVDSMRVSAASIGAKGIDGGAGVIVGIVDIGGDFAHRNFRNTDGSSRLLALWNQSGPTSMNSPFGYGQLFFTPAIDAALQQSNPYAALGYSPPRKAHGTHVMDIAAGNGKGSGQPGVAPAADLIFVDVSSINTGGAGAASVGSSFGDTVQLLEALRFIFDTAGDRPCVVNVSLGTNGGPHDGSTLVERGMDMLVSERSNRAIVIAAGNSYQHGTHVEDTVPPNGQVTLEWQVSGALGAELELWYPGAHKLAVELIDPSGQPLASVQPGHNTMLGVPGNPVVFMSSRLHDKANGDNMIGIWLAANVPPGDWGVRLVSTQAAPVPFHAWIERNDGDQTRFKRASPRYTLGSLSTGMLSICVGAYDATKDKEPIGFFSSAGPTRDGRRKPEISAPGVSVMAADSWTMTGIRRDSGTSMAAPAVTGLVALMLAAANKAGKKLTIQQIRRRLMAGVKRPKGPVDDRLGNGRACGDAI